METKHALIIDDNSNNASVLAQMLALEGMSHTVVLNPYYLQATLDNLARVDLIFLDLEMPGISGYTVFDQLRAQPRFQSTPIVAYTVHVSEINNAHSMGFHSFLGKPLDADTFPGQLAQILRGEPVWAIGG